MVRVGAVVAAAAQNHHLHERRIRQNHQQHDYGSINQPATTLTASEPSDGSELAFDDEESLLDDDDDYDAPPFPSYSAFKAAHLLVDMPMTLIILIAFGLLSAFGWPSADMIGLHWSAIGLGAVTWIASEAIRRRLFRFASSSAAWAAPNSRTTAILQSTSFLLLLHTTIQESLRLFAIYISVKGPPELVHTHGLPRPHAIPPKGFFTAFDLALGFAAAETIWRTCELLGNISLYREIIDAEIPQAWLVGEENIIGLEAPPASAQQHTPILVSNLQRARPAQIGTGVEDMETKTPEPGPSTLQTHHEETDEIQGGDTIIAIDTTTKNVDGQEENEGMNGMHKDEVDDDDTESTSSLSPSEFEYYVREKKRLEIEESYGCALFEIPVAIVAVWRLDATLLNLALTLLISLPFHEHGHNLPKHSAIPLKLPLIPTFLGVLALHWSVSLFWTLGIRRHRGRRNRDCGMPAISYGTLLVVLACFFASLAAWSALV